MCHQRWKVGEFPHGWKWLGLSGAGGNAEGLKGTWGFLLPRGHVLPGGGGPLPALTVHGVEEGSVPKAQVVPVGWEGGRGWEQPNP